MIVGLDIDGVVADFLSPFLQSIEQKIGNGPFSPEGVTDLNFKEHPYLKEEIVWKCLEDLSYSPGFWRSLTSLIKVADWQKLNDLSREKRLVFITHRYERATYSIHDISCEWLHRHGISHPIVYFTQEPKARLIQEVGVSLFVDDRHENCEDAATRTNATVLMPHRTYNQSYAHPLVKRIWNFDELFEHLV